MLEALELAAQRGDATIFSGLSFTLRPGCAALVTGANGSGKTTLLRIVAGLTRPQRGSLRWRSRHVGSYDQALRESSLYLGHASGLKDELNAEENLRLLASLHGTPATTTEVHRALEALDLREVSSLAVRFLSRGQQRRIGLARLRLARRSLWLLDEPTAALDASGVATLEAMLRQHLAAEGMAMIATHQPLALAPAPVTSLSL